MNKYFLFLKKKSFWTLFFAVLAIVFLLVPLVSLVLSAVALFLCLYGRSKPMPVFAKTALILAIIGIVISLFSFAARDYFYGSGLDKAFNDYKNEIAYDFDNQVSRIEVFAGNLEDLVVKVDENLKDVELFKEAEKASLTQNDLEVVADFEKALRDYRDGLRYTSVTAFNSTQKIKKYGDLFLDSFLTEDELIAKLTEAQSVIDYESSKLEDLQIILSERYANFNSLLSDK